MGTNLYGGGSNVRVSLTVETNLYGGGSSRLAFPYRGIDLEWCVGSCGTIEGTSVVLGYFLGIIGVYSVAPNAALHGIAVMIRPWSGG